MQQRRSSNDELAIRIKNDVGVLLEGMRKDIGSQIQSIRLDMVTKKDLDARIEDVKKDMVTKKDLDARTEDIKKDMVTKKDLDARTEDIKKDTLTKKDMVNYIGPIFQELKCEIEERTHRLGVLIEDMRVDIATALQASSSVLKHEDITRNHEGRIVDLERDVGVLKAVGPSKN